MARADGNAVKAMTESPQNPAAQGAKVAESFASKQEAIYFFQTGGEFDGMAIDELPDDVTAERIALFLRATGNFPKVHAIPLTVSLPIPRICGAHGCQPITVANAGLEERDIAIELEPVRD